MIAIKEQDILLLEFLIDKELITSEKFTDKSFFYHAVATGNLELVKLLIRHDFAHPKDGAVEICILPTSKFRVETRPNF